MFGGMVKKLIIVTGEKEVVYAELLSSLISLKDDDSENNTVVGIKDGSVEAVVWNESVFKDNKAQLGSNTKIVYIGKTKSSEAVIPSIRFDKDIEKFGIKVGSLSNKAVLFVEPNVLRSNKELYDEFYEKYIELTKKFDDSVADTDAVKKAVHTDGIDTALGKGAKAVGGFFGGVFGKKKGEHKEETAENTQNKGTDFFNFGAKIDSGKLIPDQMFRYAVLGFYLNGLAEFMEVQ